MAGSVTLKSMSFFKRDPTPKEQMRAMDREHRQIHRDIGRDRRNLEAEEKKLEAEIKQAAKRGDNDTARLLAKNLVNLRKQKTRTFAMDSKVTSMNSQAKVMQSTARMGEAMKTTTKTMQQMNKQVNPQDLANTMRQFQQENMKSEMSEEMMNEALDSIFDQDGDTEEEERVVNKVLDEIGIDISGQMARAPAAHTGALGSKGATSSKTSAEDAEIEAQLARLMAP